MKTAGQRIMRHITSHDLSMIEREDIGDDVAGGLLEDARDMPYPLGSIVLLEGERYLVAQVSYENCGEQPANYTLRGHPNLGTTPSSKAWYGHEDVTIDTLPTSYTWDLLKEASSLDWQSRRMTVVPARG